MPRDMDPIEAIHRLQEGNERFVKNLVSLEQLQGRLHRAHLAAGQQPFAVVLGCSDSRAPAEIVFDQGLGDLFVIRVAGNIVAPSLVGSVEFAVSTFGTRLVVVMGHTRCGAVTATLDTLKRGGAPASENIRDIVDRISTAVEGLVRGGGLEGDRLLAEAIRANMRASVNGLRRGSRILEEHVRKGEVLVVGAEYDLDSGRIEFFDAPTR